MLPYFNTVKEKLRLNADCMIKGTNMLMIYTIWKYETIIKLSFQCLVTLWLGLAAIKDGDKISRPEVAFFVNTAAKDSVIRAKTVIGEEMPKEKNPIFMFQGKYITASMAYYLKNSNQCYRYHKLFFNRLLSVLYGALGKKNNALKKSLDSFEKWYFAHQNKFEPYKLNKMAIDLEYKDDITFAIFEVDKNKDFFSICSSIT